MITVPHLIKMYRALLDSGLPFVERVGEFIRVRVFADNLERARPYRVGGMTLWLDWMDVTDAYYLVRRTWEPENTRFILDTLTPGDVFVDVGANVGYFTFLAAPRAKRVIAVEPMARNVYAIERSIESNRAGNVVVEPVAAGNENRDISIGYRLMASGSPSALDFFGKNKPVIPAYILHETVPQRTLLSILEKHNVEHCKILKMDIQGAEFDALTSIKPLLRNHRIEHILVEHNGSIYGNSVHDLLTECGYVCRDSRLNIVTTELRDKRDYIYSIA